MAIITQNPSEQATLTVSVQNVSPVFVFSDLDTTTFRETFESFAVDSGSAFQINFYPTPTPTPTPTSLPTSGQIWPLGFVEIGYPSATDDFDIWLF
jgi:hypothetical protein